MIRQVIGALVRYSGLPAVVRHAICRRRVTIVVYHDPKPEALARHLAYMAARYNIIDLDTYVTALNGGSLDALPPRSLVVTLDDGHARNGSLCDVLRETGVRPTIYICSQIVGTARHFWFKAAAGACKLLCDLSHTDRTDVLARDFAFWSAREFPDAEAHALGVLDVASLGPYASFGSHSRFHPVLPTCTDAEAECEIATSRAEVTRVTGAPCRHFCFPNGRYSERELALVRRAGYWSARTLDPGFNGPRQDPFRLKAICLTDDAPIDWLAVQLTGLPALLRHVGLRTRARTLRLRRKTWLRPMTARRFVPKS